MIHHVTSLTNRSFDPATFHTGIEPTTQRVDSPIEEIVATHTAVQPSRKLCMAYAMESVLTGAPLLLLDATVASIALVTASWIINASQGHAFYAGIFVQLPALLFLQTVFLSLHQLYPGAGAGPVAELRGIARSTIIALLSLSAINILLGQLPRIEFATFALTGLLIGGALPPLRWMARHLLGKTRWWGVRILLIGQRDDCLATIGLLLKRRSSGFIPAGYTCHQRDANEYGQVDRYLLGNNSDATTIARDHLAPVAGMVSSDAESTDLDRLVFQFPSVVWIDFARAARKDVDTSKLPHVFTTRMNMPFLRLAPRVAKRVIDLSVCVPTLIVLAIPMLVITGMIKFLSPGPAFFGHTRIGQHGRQFKAWKFRTMVTNGDEVLEKHLAENPAARSEWERDQKLRNDPRVLGTLGRVLRKWSLDELPQLWNVLRGEMSLVGPRPIVYSEIAKYSRGYLAYSHMLPGITGLWQISGRNNTSYATRVSIDEHYARNWSPWLDLWVLMKTPIVVITRNGAY